MRAGSRGRGSKARRAGSEQLDQPLPCARGSLHVPVNTTKNKTAVGARGSEACDVTNRLEPVLNF